MKNYFKPPLFLLLSSAISLYSITAFSQIKDTIQITEHNINTSFLKEGTSRILVYVKMNKDSIRTLTQFWTRTVKRIEYKGSSAIEITQEWEDKDSIMHLVKSISDAATMKPLYHKTWWRTKTPGNTTTKTTNETEVDFINNIIEYNRKKVHNEDTSKQEKKIWEAYQTAQNKFFLNWHLDLETFPLLPYKKDITFLIPFYDPGTISGFQNVAYTVRGSAVLPGYDNQKIDCWLLFHEEKGNLETFWISKKTRQVLKLEQIINDKIYRFKIALAFSN